MQRNAIYKANCVSLRVIEYLNAFCAFWLHALKHAWLNREGTITLSGFDGWRNLLLCFKHVQMGCSWKPGLMNQMEQPDGLNKNCQNSHSFEQEYSLNLNILLGEGKEINIKSQSKGDWKGKKLPKMIIDAHVYWIVIYIFSALAIQITWSRVS